MTTDLIMRVNVRTTTTTSSGFTDKLVKVAFCRGMVGTSSMVFSVRTGDDATYYVLFCSLVVLYNAGYFQNIWLSTSTAI